MKKLTYMAGIALLLAILPAALTAASSRIEVSGTRAFTGGGTQVEDWHTVGDTCVGVREWPIALDGTIEADCTLRLRIVEHDACPNEPYQNRENWTWYGSCTGAVAGQEGEFVFEGPGVFGPGPPLYHRAKTVLTGSEGLENLHGVLRFWGSPAEGMHYDGFVVFDQSP
ncbi:MAG: hypothetical protein JXA09_06770 [Anaerolineae bacterium]|nr:hypothetical protein [Anaerolineae bacterium]